MARPAAPVGAPKVDEAREDYRKRLEALRDRLEARVSDPEVSSRDLAALVARLESVLAALVTLPAPVRKEDTGDLLAQRRAARQARAAGAAGP